MVLGMEFKEEEISFRKFINDFPSTTYATFALYGYPAKFIPQVIAFILKNYGKPGMSIFDPFAGYGTAGVVARIYGFNYELWDLNPLLELFHEVATSKPVELDIKNVIQRMRMSREEFVPKWNRQEYWFHKDFLPLLYKVWGFWHSLDDNYTKLLTVIPLLKVTRYFSYDDLQRQKLSKSPKSMNRIRKLLEEDWENIFFSMLEDETRNIYNRLLQYQSLNPKPVKHVVKGGVDSLKEELSEERDILITSPPYLQSHEYIRHFKLELFWLGYSDEDLKRLLDLEIPYRDVNRISVYSETYHRCRNMIHEPHLLKMFDNYLWAILGCLSRLQEKITSYIFVFVGRPSMRGRQIPVDRMIAEHLALFGWKHERTLVDAIVARRMFSYAVNPATKIRDQRTKTENLVILKRI